MFLLNVIGSFLLGLAIFLAWIYWRTRHVRRGFRQLAEKEYAEAIATFERIIEKEPPRLNNYINLSVAYLGDKRYAEALKVMDDAIRLGLIAPPQEIESPNVLEVTFIGNRGVALEKLGRYDEALGCLEQALRHTEKEHPFYPFRLLSYARVFVSLGRKEPAAKVLGEIDRWFEEHEMTDPQHVEVFQEDKQNLLRDFDLL